MPHRIHLPRTRRAAGRLALLATAAMGCGAAQALVIDEGTMDAGEWAQTVVTQAGPATLAIFATPFGGHPDSNWQHQYAVPNGNALTTRVREANIYTAASYDPAHSGALASLSIAFDVQVVFTSFSDGTAGALIPALAQDGRIYRQAVGAIGPLSPNWSPRSFTSTAATDWIEQDTNAHPDFSASGGVMQFGYLFTLGTSCPNPAGCRAASAGSALDNFHVEAIAASVPEPASAALLLVGGGLLMARRRRFEADSGAASSADPGAESVDESGDEPGLDASAKAGAKVAS